MARKNKKLTKKSHRITGSKEKLSLISKGFGDMTYKDLKRRAVALGMPFPDACAGDSGMLQSWILKTTNKPDTSLINKYDEWMDKQLELAGYAKDDPMRHYQLNLGFVSEDAVTKQKTTKRIKGLESPKKKKKREKDENNLWKGTKKSYTFELTNKDLSIERIIRRVTKKFPDANPKSIQQWYRAALRKRGIDYKTHKPKGKE